MKVETHFVNPENATGVDHVAKAALEAFWVAVHEHKLTKSDILAAGISLSANFVESQSKDCNRECDHPPVYTVFISGIYRAYEKIQKYKRELRRELRQHAIH